MVHVEDVAGVGAGGHPADERSNTVVLHGWDISEAADAGTATLKSEH